MSVILERTPLIDERIGGIDHHRRGGAGFSALDDIEDGTVESHDDRQDWVRMAAFADYRRNTCRSAFGPEAAP